MAGPIPKQQDLKLTDILARDRTTLANERTLLAYARTALMMGISGLTLVKLIPEGGLLMLLAGALLAALGVVTFFWGVWSYVRVKRELDSLVE